MSDDLTPPKWKREPDPKQRDILIQEAMGVDAECCKIAPLSRVLFACDELLRIIAVMHQSPDTQPNRLFFQLVVRAAVHDCGLSPRHLSAASKRSIPARMIERYASGEAVRGAITVPGGQLIDARRGFIDEVIVPTVRRKLRKVRDRRELLNRNICERYGLPLELSIYNSTNVTEFPEREKIR